MNPINSAHQVFIAIGGLMHTMINPVITDAPKPQKKKKIRYLRGQHVLSSYIAARNLAKKAAITH